MNTINLEEKSEVEAYYTIAHPINEGIDSLSGHYEIMGVKNEIPFDLFSFLANHNQSKSSFKNGRKTRTFK